VWRTSHFFVFRPEFDPAAWALHDNDFLNLKITLINLRISFFGLVWNGGRWRDNTAVFFP
jgi:hypothetical protein